MGYIGIIVVFAMVFGGYIFAGGKMHVILHSAPHEMIIIAGAALGAYLIANPMKTIKSGFKLSIKALTAKGPQKQDYLELLQMLFQLFQVFRKEGPQGIEKHIEDPDKSEIFKAYPSFMHNHHAVHFLCDTMKITLSAELSPYDVDDLLDGDMKAIHAEEHMAQHAIQSVGDGFPINPSAYAPTIPPTKIMTNKIPIIFIINLFLILNFDFQLESLQKNLI